MARRITEIARLVRVLESDKYTRLEKLKQVKMVQRNGDLTVDEAIELWHEYYGCGQED